MAFSKIEITLSDIKNCQLVSDGYRNIFTDNFVASNLVALNAENPVQTPAEYLAYTLEDIITSNFVVNLGYLQQDEVPVVEHPPVDVVYPIPELESLLPSDISRLATIIVAPSGVVADIIMNPSTDGKKITRTQLYDLIAQKQIVFNVNKEFLNRLALRPVYEVPFTFAQGVDPIAGSDGYVKCHFDIESPLKPVLDESGNVDFKNLVSSITAKTDQLLCEILPPVPPVHGKSVYGKTIPGKEPKKAAIVAGPNTYFSDDNTKIFAGCDGQIIYKNNKISINKELFVTNVNNETGNIDFAGSVRISGDVYSGYTVKAGGNITVAGSVEGATLIADGDITISNGMNGNEIGSATAGGSFTSKFIENATVTAGEKIQTDMALNSVLNCEGSVIFSGRRGCMIGGECSAGTQIQAQAIGNDSNIPVSLTINVLPRLTKELAKIDVQIDEYQSIRNMFAGMFAKVYQADTPNLDVARIFACLKIAFHYSQITAMQKPLNLRKEVITKRLAKLTNGSIMIKGCIHRNVSIDINNLKCKTTTSYNFTNIRIENDNIIFAPFGK